MSKANTISVFNNTHRIITLHGQVGRSTKAREAKRFTTTLDPHVMTLVPQALWTIHKRSNAVQALLDTEELISGKEPKEPARPRPPAKSAQERAEEAAIAAIKEDDAHEGTEED